MHPNQDTHPHGHPHAICIPTGIHTRTGPYTSNWICTVLAHHKAYKPGLGPTVQDRSWVYAPTRMHIPQDPGHMRPPGHTRPESHTHPAPGYAQRRHPSGIPAWSPGHKAWLPPTLHTGGHIVKGVSTHVLFMAVHGCPWLPMATQGCPWHHVPMAAHGYPRLPIPDHSSP